MKKIHSIRKGRIWLNVIRTDGDNILVTINKTYMRKKGLWERTRFLNPRRGDILNLMDCLTEFHELEKMVEAEGGSEMSPSALLGGDTNES